MIRNGFQHALNKISIWNAIFGTAVNTTVCFMKSLFLISPFTSRLTMSVPHAKKQKIESELEKFDAVFPRLLDDLTSPDIYESEIADALNRFREVSWG